MQSSTFDAMTVLVPEHPGATEDAQTFAFKRSGGRDAETAAAGEARLSMRVEDAGAGRVRFDFALDQPIHETPLKIAMSYIEEEESHPLVAGLLQSDGDDSQHAPRDQVGMTFALTSGAATAEDVAAAIRAGRINVRARVAPRDPAVRTATGAPAGASLIAIPAATQEMAA